MELTCGETMEKPLVVITGASSGIGAAMAQVFSDAGFPLGLIARNKEAMEMLALPDAVIQSADVTNYKALEKAIAAIVRHFGPVDCLINNAGYVKAGDFTQMTHDDHLHMVKVNLMGVINGIEIVLPSMRQKNHGTIINVSSIADRSSRPFLATYAATKAAVKSLSESLRKANAKYGIRICNFAPAKVLTPMLENADLNDGNTINAIDVAKAALWIYEQPQSISVRDIVITPTNYEP